MAVVAAPRVRRRAHARPRPALHRRRAVTAAKFTVSAGVVAFLLAKGGVRDVTRTLQHTSIPWLALGFAFGVAGALVTITQWHRLLRASGVTRSWWRCFRIEWACDAFDAALPSSIGGDVVRAVLVSESPEERARAASSVVLRRLMNLPGMVVLMTVGLAASWSGPGAGRIRPYVGAAVVVALVGAALVASPLAGRLAALPVAQRWWGGRALAKVLVELDAVRGRPGVLAAASARGVVFWTAVVLSQWSYMHAVGVHVPLAYAAVVVTVVNAVTMLPISLGGYGVREGSFSAFLAVGGLASIAQGIGVGLCVTAQTLVFGLLGLPAYLTLGRRRAPSPPPGQLPARTPAEVVPCAS
jgi:uncharacterized membrane protein YbhN (UPF0104 family)